MFDTKLSPELIASLSNILSEAEGVSIVCHDEMRGIWLYTKENDTTELRLSMHGSYRVVVSRVQLVNRRIGTLTKVLQTLVDFCCSNGIHAITVQAVITKEMSSWCLKHGFIPHPMYSFAVDDYIVGDYILNLADIASA